MEPVKWRQFFQDKANEEFSATRLVLFIWATGVLVVWGIVSFNAKSLQAIPESVITILGLALGAKAVQRFGER
jgi:predicted membrane protein